MDCSPTGWPPRVRAGFLAVVAFVPLISLRAQEAGSAAPAPDADINRPRPQNVTVYGDFLQGLGNITLPVGYALDGAAIGRTIAEPDRESTYFGGAITWQAKPGLGFDFAFSQGTSTGNFTFKPEEGGRWPQAAINSSFTLDDTWLQAYVRYDLKPLFRRRVNMYLRGGFTYMDAEYEGISEPSQAFYRNTGSIRDLMGNVGLGLSYALPLVKGIRPSIVFEAEGFGGLRSREFSEVTLPIQGDNSMDNMIFGGLTRLMLRAEYRFGKAKQWRAMLEGGVQARWMFEAYGDADRQLVDDRDPSGNTLLPNSVFESATKMDLLWGPYVRAGLRYSF